MAPITSSQYDTVAAPLLGRGNIHSSPVVIARADASPTPIQLPPNFNPGKGTVPPTSINNNGIFALFGILSASLVIASIWFFFWAKNGGFRWRKGDWEEYKSTVLRRKGPNGTTLSGGTKTTVLGGGSVVGSLGSQELASENASEKGSQRTKKMKKSRKERPSRKDDDVRAYRHEKVARVGGLNKESEAMYHDQTETDMSEISSPQRQHTRTKPSKLRAHDPHTPRKFSYNPGADSAFSVASDDSHRPLRASPHHDRHSNTSTPTHTPRRHYEDSPLSPTKPKRSSGLTGDNRRSYRASAAMPGNYTEPLDMESRYDESEVSSEQLRNTKAYHHPIPGLSSSKNGGGFRRGGGGRRDSLGDSDDEGTQRY
jgi:hypothetical protein